MNPSLAPADSATVAALRAENEKLTAALDAARGKAEAMHAVLDDIYIARITD